MTHYLIKHNVPILDEHTLKDEDGKVLVEVDARRLHEIARKNNRRVQETGDLVPIIIGHTKDDSPEDQQPEIVGYASNFRVRPFRRTGRKAITATFKFFRHLVAKIKKFPRRSVELWLSDWKIDPIALLGATTPERDLGLLQLSRSGTRKYRREIPPVPMPQPMPQPPMPTNPASDTSTGADPQLVQAILEALKQTDVWKWCESQMARQETPPEREGEMPAEGEMPPEEEAEDDLYDDEEMGNEGEARPESEEEPERYNADCYPSGSNTGIPKTEKMRMAKDQERGQVARLSRQLKGLQVKYQRTEREKDLIQLESEGYQLDRVEELDTVATMSDNQYRRHLSTIRKRYQKAPVGPVNYFHEHARSQGAPSRSKERSLEIAQYAAGKGISYSQALEDLEGDTF